MEPSPSHRLAKEGGRRQKAWRWALVLIAFLVIAGCSVAQDGPAPEPPPESITLDGITYRAEVRFEKPRGRDVEVAPIRLRPWVTMTNEADGPHEIRLAGCPVRLRVFQGSSRTGKPVWDEERQEQGSFTCMQDPYAVAVGPGGSHEETDSFDASRVLNAGVAPGRYYFSVVLALQDRRMELAAGEGELTYGIDGLVFTAESSMVDIAPRNLQTVVTVTNISDRSVYIEFGACAVSLQAYLTARRTGVPAWDESKLSRWCLAYLATRRLAPGESASPKEFQRFIPELDVMGTTMPDGKYFITATIAVNDTTVHIPAGEIRLTRKQDPLPTVRTVGGLRWEAKTAPTADSIGMTTIVTITNTMKEPVTIRLPQTCPVLLYAYLDRARRDAAFRSGEADVRHESCTLDLMETTFSAGESKELRTDVSRGWQGFLLPRRYYLVASVHTGEQSVVLAAGEMDMSATGQASP